MKKIKKTNLWNLPLIRVSIILFISLNLLTLHEKSPETVKKESKNSSSFIRRKI